MQDSVHAKMLAKSNKTIRHIANIISSKTSTPIGLPGQESTNQSAENSFHDAVVDAVDKLAYEKNSSAQVCTLEILYRNIQSCIWF